MKELAKLLNLPLEVVFIGALFFCPLIAFVLYRIYLRLIHGTKIEWFHNEAMPRELRSASLVYNERPISMQHPISIRGVIDQGFRTKRGKLVLLDTKTRSSHRVYSGDRLQLSLYAFILSNNGLRDLARYGYIRTVVSSDQDKRSIYYHKIPLMSHAEVLKHVRR